MSKEDLHKLVDALPERQTDVAARVLEALRTGRLDPVELALLSAPEDDEPETPEEAAAVEEAREALKRGEVIADDELRRRLGL